MKSSLAAICVLAAAAPLMAGASLAGPEGPALAGRWQGPNYRMAAKSADCKDGRCQLTLDISACDSGWCGIEVAADGSCAPVTGLVLKQGETYTDGNFGLEGTLTLAAGTEPYAIEGYFSPAEKGDPAAGTTDQPMRLSMQGDTGGVFRAFRRSFPFHATLARIGDATCKPTQKPVS